MNLNYTIKDMPIEDRPQEKMIKLGPNYLSNAELLALIIRTGTKTKTSVELSQEILNSIKKESASALGALKNITMSDLMSIKGVGESKASMIIAAINLGIRLSNESVFERKKLTSPCEVVDYVMQDMRSLSVEEFRIVNLNTKKEVDSIKLISRGTINATVVHPREVYRCAIENRAHSIILLHNHPSGDPNPSFEDKDLTKKISKSGDIVGIPVVDHIIIGDNRYFSFLEHGML